jgi:hypothetical protein
MDPSVTRARLATMAYLGIRPSEIARMQPQDLGAAAVLVRTGRGAGSALSQWPVLARKPRSQR